MIINKCQYRVGSSSVSSNNGITDSPDNSDNKYNDDGGDNNDNNDDNSSDSSSDSLAGWEIFLTVFGCVIALVAVILLIVYRKEIKASCGRKKSDDRPSTPNSKVVPATQGGKTTAVIWATSETNKPVDADPPPYVGYRPPSYSEAMPKIETVYEEIPKVPNKI